MVDIDFLNTLGLGSLPVDEKNKLLQAIYERLEMNVGMRLAERMTDSQLDEFEGFIDRNDEAGALRWLETNFPNYKQVVAEELEKLKVEISQSAPQILAASQQQMVGEQAPQQQPIQPQPQQPDSANVPTQEQYNQPSQPQSQQPQFNNQPQPPQAQPEYSSPLPSQPQFNQPQSPAGPGVSNIN